MTPTADKIDQASGFLDYIKAHLNKAERGDLALELVDATRNEPGYEDVLTPWAIMALVRQHPDYEHQLKEFRNLEESGELFAGTPLAGVEPFSLA